MRPIRTDRSLRALRLTAALSLLIAPLTLQPAGADAASARDTLVVAYYGVPASIDPAISYDYAGPAMMHALYESLVRMKGTSVQEIEGDLATSWTSNANKTLWTFKLRHGVTFHDGTPFNAAAVQFSIARNIAIAQAPSYVFGQFVAPKDVVALDPYTVQFRLSAPAPRFLYALASLYGSYMVSPTAIKKHEVKGDWGQKWIAAGNDAGSGPYMLTQYSPNVSATMSKYPGYWRGWSGQHVSKVIMQFVNSNTTRREELEHGDADIANVFTPQDMTAMESNPALKVDSTSVYANWTIVPTVAGPLASPKARLALEYAFEYNGFQNGLLKGFARPARGPLASFADGYDPKTPVFQTDLNKAKSLFAEAGVNAGTTLTLWYSAPDQSQLAVAEDIQGQLAQIGMTVKISPRDSGTYYNALFGSDPISKRPNLWIGGWSGDYNDAIAWFLPLYHTKTKDGSAGGANAGMYSDKQVDQLTEQAATTVDLAKRQALLSKVQHILTVEDPAAVYVGEESNTTTYRRSLHGYYYNTCYVLAYDFYSMWK